jgi:uncharacterized Zn finger protein (UPF0148 family)
MNSPRVIHGYCGQPAVQRGGEWWCPQCQRWVSPEQVEKNRRAQALKDLEVFLPKIPPPKQRGT